MLAPLCRPLGAILFDRRETLVRQWQGAIGLIGRQRLRLIHVCVAIAVSVRNAGAAMRI